MELRDSSTAPEMAATDSANGIPTQAAETNTVENSPVAPDDALSEVKADEPEAAIESETVNETSETNETERPAINSREDVIEALRDLLDKDAAQVNNDDVARLRYLFYHFAPASDTAETDVTETETESQIKEVDPVETEFTELMAKLKEARAQARAAIEAARAEALARKKEIINSIRQASEDTDQVNRHFQSVRDLQNEFRTAGEVPPEAQAEIWKEYQEAVEHYYDQLKINKELRDYDFRKNLADKQLLIEQAEQLTAETDVVAAFRSLQVLHDKWREIGPVAKEMRQEIWDRFKDASAVINKAYQAHFEERKAQERENELAKTAICERVETLDWSEVNTYAAWDALTTVILEAQADWKKIGFASRKANNDLFARFRATCDKFFSAKAEFFKSMKDSLAANLERKIALCERAEALKDSTEWRSTTEALVELQKEWKTIGAVPKKQSDAVWRRFLDACDAFFDAKKKATSSTRRTEQANLKAKQALAQRLRDIPADTPRDQVAEAIRQARTEWSEIGHVPFRDKEKVYQQFRAAIDELYTRHDLSGRAAAADRFRSRVSSLEGNASGIDRERERLVRARDRMIQELATYENNLGFLTSKSKSGASMVREMERRVERLRNDIADIKSKIEMLDAAPADKATAQPAESAE